MLSSKMAVFYGLYTYFVHSLFDLNVVFVPCSEFFVPRVFFTDVQYSEFLGFLLHYNTEQDKLGLVYTCAAVRRCTMIGINVDISCGPATRHRIYASHLMLPNFSIVMGNCAAE